MRTESRVKFISVQNISGASQKQSSTIEEAGDLL